MSTFYFFPELFEVRGDALEVLADAGYHWLSDFQCVDLRHDGYGLELYGIEDQATATKILAVLSKAFPQWLHAGIYNRDEEPDTKWWVRIQRDPDPDEPRYT